MNVDTVKLLYQDLPVCPFLWKYNCHLFPIKFAQKMSEHDILLNDELDHFLKSRCKSFDYYTIEQEIESHNEEFSKILNIGFHTWLFSKTNQNKNMTNHKLNSQILTMLVTSNSNIKQTGKYGIEINSLGKRRVHIHNNRLSPKHDNSINLETKPTNFISVCINEHTKECCITLHKLIYL